MCYGVSGKEGQYIEVTKLFTVYIASDKYMYSAKLSIICLLVYKCHIHLKLASIYSTIRQNCLPHESHQYVGLPYN
jgi:hypothetical protein